MSALICGSMAYDTIMVFHDKFKNHILPDKVHMLNVSFLVPELRREFGGCAGNIAYSLKLLGVDPLPMATVGSDFAPYAQWMDENGISRKFIKQIDGTYTAQAFITTDMDDNQITAFHPGAMSLAHENTITGDEGVTLGMVSPDGRNGMVEHAEQMAEANIPFIFDPGQGMPMYDGKDLLKFMEQATWATFNDYEAQLLIDRTGKTPHELAAMVDALIITKGSEGSHVYFKNKRLEIPPVTPKAIHDPTGCGDAYRAGLVYGLLSGMDWETTGRVASLMGAIKIEHFGTQKHRFTLDEFRAAFQQAYGYSLS